MSRDHAVVSRLARGSTATRTIRYAGRDVTSDLAQGMRIAGRFKLERLLGVGGMGQVWAATEEATGQGVAMKFVLQAHPDLYRRFLREVKALRSLAHPNVVGMREVVELPDGAPVMVMDLLEGETLAALLDREPLLTLPVTAKLLLPVLSAVGSAHALGIVHRDLKPENIFLARGPNKTLEVKVLDFGIAKVTSTEPAQNTTGLTATGSLLGTPSFMSPEQVFGEKDIDHRCDVWALGLIAYQCLTGVLPTHADNVGQILKAILNRPIPKVAAVQPGIPERVATVVDRMLSRDVEGRPSLHEVAEAFSEHADLEVPSFGEASPVILSALDPATGDGEGRAVVRVAESAAMADTVHAVTSSTRATGTMAPVRSRPVALALILAAIAGGLTGWALLRWPSPEAGSAATTGGQAAASTGAGLVHTAAPELPAAASATAATAAPSVEPAATVTPTAAPTATATAATAPVTGPPVAKRPRPPATATAAAPPPPPTAAPGLKVQTWD